MENVAVAVQMLSTVFWTLNFVACQEVERVSVHGGLRRALRSAPLRRIGADPRRGWRPAHADSFGAAGFVGAWEHGVYARGASVAHRAADGLRGLPRRPLRRRAAAGLVQPEPDIALDRRGEGAPRRVRLEERFFPS